METNHSGGRVGCCHKSRYVYTQVRGVFVGRRPPTWLRHPAERKTNPCDSKRYTHTHTRHAFVNGNADDDDDDDDPNIIYPETQRPWLSSIYPSHTYLPIVPKVSAGWGMVEDNVLQIPRLKLQWIRNVLQHGIHVVSYPLFCCPLSEASVIGPKKEESSKGKQWLSLSCCKFGCCCHCSCCC